LGAIERQYGFDGVQIGDSRPAEQTLGGTDPERAEGFQAFASDRVERRVGSAMSENA
jgi:hypothetical protein